MAFNACTLQREELLLNPIRTMSTSLLWIMSSEVNVGELWIWHRSENRKMLLWDLANRFHFRLVSLPLAQLSRTAQILFTGFFSCALIADSDAYSTIWNLSSYFWFSSGRKSFSILRSDLVCWKSSTIGVLPHNSFWASTSVLGTLIAY